MSTYESAIPPEADDGDVTLTPEEQEVGAYVCELPPAPERVLDDDVSDFRAGLIRNVEKKWVNGTKLRYWFFDSGRDAGAETQMDMVRAGFDVWKDVGIGLTFEEVSEMSEAEIRIGFRQRDGSWSYIGRDVLDIPGQAERTMNFGWDLTRDPRGVDTPVHEIGHTLGFPHEHQNPFAGIEWDEEAVYQRFGGPPNNWSRAKTFHNILRKLPQSEVEGSDWDADSVMHYGFGPGLIIRPPEFRNGIRPALGLSEKDKAQARLFYPPVEDDRYPELKPYSSARLSLEPAEQVNFAVLPSATRTYTIQTFGRSDTVMVLFEDQGGDLRYVAGDDDSGSRRNARIRVRLYRGRQYVLRLRLYSRWAGGDSVVMLW